MLHLSTSLSLHGPVRITPYPVGVRGRSGVEKNALVRDGNVASPYAAIDLRKV